MRLPLTPGDNSPVFDIPFRPYKLSPVEISFVKTELHKLEINGAIRRVQSKPMCVSPIKCVRKKNGKYRLVTDLRLLNSCIDTPSFQNEGINTVSSTVRHGDYLVKTDLKDGFFHIPVHPLYYTYLGFEFQRQWYVWCVLPFGLSCSPYFFHKCLRPIVTFLREQGIRVVLYVDDCLIAASKSFVTDHRDFVLQTFEDLGLTVNYEKSVKDPSTRLEFIGYIVDTLGPDNEPWLFISSQKILKLKKDIRWSIDKEFIQARLLAKIAGQAFSMSKAILPGKLKLCSLYAALQTKHGWSDFISIDADAKDDLLWWLGAIDHWNGSPLTPRAAQLQIWTDASNSGWGAVCENSEASGSWDRDTICKHINLKELLAVHLALRSFSSKIQNKTVQVLTDNATTVAYINNLGGPVQALTVIAEGIWCAALTF